MNYLAHATLAEATDEARLGSLLGDFAKGLDEPALPPAVRSALQEHRDVDRWFDSADAIRAERRRYPRHLRRFSGILTDVFFDHFLVLRWEDLVPRPIEEVTSSLYRALTTHASHLPPRLREVAPSMTQHDWLGSYGDLANVKRALQGIERRLSRPTPLSEGLAVLEARYGEIEQLVLTVFPKAQAYVEARRRALLEDEAADGHL